MKFLSKWVKLALVAVVLCGAVGSVVISSAHAETNKQDEG